MYIHMYMLCAGIPCVWNSVNMNMFLARKDAYAVICFVAALALSPSLACWVARLAEAHQGASSTRRSARPPLSHYPETL